MKLFPPNKLFISSTLPITGILETDITFLVIFSMVFLLSCYFACKYCHFHLLYVSLSLSFHE